jgi:hypothetical protein
MPPIDAMTRALEREAILARIAALMEKGSTLRQACVIVGEKESNVYRWRGYYAAGGLEGLRVDYTACGRPPAIPALNEWELTKARGFYVQTSSKKLSLEMLAALPGCRQEVADFINKRRRSDSMPRSLMDQLDVSEAAKALHKGPKAARKFVTTHRTLTYLDALGHEQPLLVGDLSERDDMSNNYVGWIDWPQGGDPCSDRFGVRPFRGQFLVQIDVRSLFPQSFCFVVRNRDSYRADDIWQWVGQSYRDIFKPALGERWERGIWKSNLLRGTPIAAGHTSNAERFGGMSALGLRIFEAQTPASKIIENRFRLFQRLCTNIPGQIGAKRGEMERETKLWMECQQGRRDPRNHFLSYAALCDEGEKRLVALAHREVRGTIYNGVPAEIYERGLKERGDQLRRLTPEETYLFSRDRAQATIAKGEAFVRYVRPDRTRGAWVFRHPGFLREEGNRMAVYFDRENAGLGATMVPMRERKFHEEQLPIYSADLTEGIPTFAIGLDPEGGRASQAMVDELEWRKACEKAVRSEYRALGIGARRIARVTQARDGAGGSATVEDFSSNQGGPGPRSTTENDISSSITHRRGQRRNLGATTPARTAQPLSSDPAYMARLEREFAEANPGDSP